MSHLLNQTVASVFFLAKVIEYFKTKQFIKSLFQLINITYI